MAASETKVPVRSSKIVNTHESMSFFFTQIHTSNLQMW
jgi:hypothetical protein